MAIVAIDVIDFAWSLFKKNVLGSSVEHGRRLQPLRGGDSHPERKTQSGKHQLDENPGEKKRVLLILRSFRTFC